MNEIINVLLDHSVLGCWVIYSIIREKSLMKRMDEQEQRFRSERITWDRERTRWMRTLGRKLSDNTIIDVQDN
tara:strand:+ start:141 stop:359 length:219 start_codon:yes stop_codon:yes gene_type:complete